MNWAITAAFDYQALSNLSKGLVASLSLFSAMKKHIVDVAEMTAGTLICAEYIRISAHFFSLPPKTCQDDVEMPEKPANMFWVSSQKHPFRLSTSSLFFVLPFAH